MNIYNLQKKLRRLSSRQFGRQEPTTPVEKNNQAETDGVTYEASIICRTLAGAPPQPHDDHQML